MLAMVVLLVLCVGAVSATSDIDSVALTNDNSDVIVLSEGSDDIGDLSENGTDENGTDENGTDEANETNDTYKINAPESTNINLDVKDIEFDFNVTGENGTVIEVLPEDLGITFTYSYEVVEGNETTTVDESINITEFTIEDGKLKFSLKDIKNFTANAVLLITYKNCTPVTVNVKPVIEAKIVVIKEESSTKYQNAYIVVQLINNITNQPVAGKQVNFKFVNSSYSTISWGFTTDENGKYKFDLDGYYFKDTYVPVANLYSVIVSTGSGVVSTAQNVTFNITKSAATFSASNYSATYASGKKFNIKLVNSNTKKPIVNSKIGARVWFSSKSYQDYTLYTNGSGIASIGINLGAGTYKVQIYNSNTNLNVASITRYIVIKKVSAKLSASKITAYYNCGSKFKVKMVNAKTGVPLKGATVLLNIYTGSKYKAAQITTDDNGIAYWTVSGISIGTHKVLVGSGSTGADANVVQTYIVLKKGKTTVTAPVVTNNYRKSQYFKVTVKNAATKKAISGIYITVKVYTGKKYKTYKVKTNSNGVASLNTYALSKGTHKVVISSTNKYYTVSKSGNLIVIK